MNDHKNVNMPDKLISFRQYPFAEEWGLEVTRYWDEPGLYTLNRLQCEAECRYLQERFAFYAYVKVEGTLNKQDLLDAHGNLE